jgi:hypothetical protein
MNHGGPNTMERDQRIAALSAAAVLLLSGCSSEADDGAAEGIQPIEEPDPVEAERDPLDGEPEPEPESEPDVEPDPEPADIDITVVPDEITDEYVEAVFVELERLYAEALKEMRQNDDELNIEVTDRLGEIFDNEATLPTNLRVFQDAASEGFPNVREAEEIGPRSRRIISLISTDQSCIYVETSVDSSLVLIESSVDEQINFVELLPKTAERPVLLNSTPWVYGRMLVPFDEMESEEFTEDDPCSA